MKSRKLTVVELVLVIVIIVALFFSLFTSGGISINKAKFSGCQLNLLDLGKQFISYSLDEDHFPCTVVKDDSKQVIEAKCKDKKRSTLEVYNTFRENDNNDIDAKRFFCPASPCRAPRKKSSRLKKSNVSYHYVNSDVATRIMKGNQGLIRDLNEGHGDDSEYGAVLMADGSIHKVEKIGRQRYHSPHGNYKVNWYRNKKTFENYQEFDNYLNDVDERKVDEVD